MEVEGWDLKVGGWRWGTRYVQRDEALNRGEKLKQSHLRQFLIASLEGQVKGGQAVLVGRQERSVAIICPLKKQVDCVALTTHGCSGEGRESHNLESFM